MAAARMMDQDAFVEFFGYLEGFIHVVIADQNLDKLALMNTVIELTDEIYRKLANLSLRDSYTRRYFGFIIHRLFFEFSNKGIHAFFIVDNSMRDDRFKLVVELFQAAGFTTVYPYKSVELKHSPEYTKLPARELKEVEKQLSDATEERKHILYVEKDDSVDYIKDVYLLAKELQGNYLCFFRNQSVDTPGTASRIDGPIF